MQINPEYIDQFDAYLRGGLSEMEVAAFEAQLRSDSEMAEAFEAYKAVELGIRKHFRSELKARLLEVDRQMGEPQKPKSFGNRNAWIASSIAAAVIIGLLVVSVFSETSHEKLASKYWPAEEGLPVKMSTATRFDSAMNAFKQEQWERSAELLQKVSPQSDTVHYFLGVVFFNLQQYDDATHNLAAIDRANGWYDEGQFRLALSHLAADRIDEARAILNQIVSSNSPYKDKATAVLEEM